ncbi:pseudouridine synthase [Denitrobaculum tricleocarpae]|uniref:Pseudouridine synthase n=1 Tax=Denitrobaculum tricleocarpae TaxID=2591009 RepID=A0A545U1T2_9PROT|nr:pseudouridine synthase [Denitrobaculum tricleocarpae]
MPSKRQGAGKKRDARKTTAPSAKSGNVRPAKASTYEKTPRTQNTVFKTPKDDQPHAAKASKGERIAKIIARAGLCSRRDAERWIAEGRVKLDGKTLDTAAVVVTPDQSIVVDGQPLPAPEQTRVWRFHKPRGVMTTRKDPEGRPTVFDGLPRDLPRLEPVGRLDYNSEGLLLFTNDGELKRKLELPSTGWSRRYRVRVHGRVDPAQIKALEKGITVEGVNYGPIQAQLEHQAASNAWLAMTLREGKNREIRRICEHLGLTVNRLIRVSYGPFQLGDLAPGKIESIPARILRDQLGVESRDAAPASTAPDGKPTRTTRPARNKVKAGLKGKAGGEKPGTAKTSPGRTSAGRPPAKSKPRLPKGATDLTDATTRKTKGGGRKSSTNSRKLSSKAATRTSKTPAAPAKRGGKNANRRRTT